MDDFGSLMAGLGSQGIDWGSPADVAHSLSPGPLNSDTMGVPVVAPNIPDMSGLTVSPPQMNKNVDYGAMLQGIADMTHEPSAGASDSQDIPTIQRAAPPAPRLGSAAYPFGH